MQVLARLALLAVPLGGGTAFFANNAGSQPKVPTTAPVAAPAATPQDHDAYDVARERAAAEARDAIERSATRAMLARKLAQFRLAPEMRLTIGDREIPLTATAQPGPREFEFDGATVRCMRAEAVLVDGAMPDRTLYLVRAAADDGWNGCIDLGNGRVAVRLEGSAP